MGESLCQVGDDPSIPALLRILVETLLQDRTHRVGNAHGLQLQLALITALQKAEHHAKGLLTKVKWALLTQDFNGCLGQSRTVLHGPAHAAAL
jgi:hypothetical protein